MNRRLLAIFLLTVSLLAQSVDVKPADVARDFYVWYLRLVAQNKDPLKQDPNGVKKYVAPSMLAEISRLSKRPEGLGADPFLQAQDFPEDWKDHVAVVQRANTGTSATILVTLGLPKGEPNNLKVDLRKDAGVWKLIKVERVFP